MDRIMKCFKAADGMSYAAMHAGKGIKKDSTNQHCARWAALCLAILSFSFFFACGLAETMSVPVEVRFGQTEARSMLEMINAFRSGNREDNPNGQAVTGHPWQLKSDGSIEILSPRSALKIDARLEKIAMQRAAEIAVYFSHTQPNGEIGMFSYGCNGENIAAGYDTAEAAFNAWMETDENYSYQGHRRNMLKEDFRSVGIGHAVYGDYHYWVQVFGTSSGSGVTEAADDSIQIVGVAVDLDIIHAVMPEPNVSVSLLMGDTLDLKKTARIRTDADTSWPGNYIVLPASYTSRDDTVVTVDENGIATAVGEGETTVQVSSTDGTYTVTFTLNVYQDFEDIFFVPSKRTLDYYEGDTDKMLTFIEPEGAFAEIWYASSDETKATIDADGTLHFLRPGYVWIICYYKHLGANGYTGTDFRFAIHERQSIQNAVVTLSETALSYTGEPLTPDVTVVLDGYTLGKANYDVVYADNTDIGTATVTITGKEAYKDRVSASFKIVARDISDASVLPEYDHVGYNGEAHEPKVTVILDGKPLADTDYDVSYEDNVRSGTARIRVSGKGNYAGTSLGSFIIGWPPFEQAEVTLVPESFVYNGEAQYPTIQEVNIGGWDLSQKADAYEISFEDNVNAGEARVILRAKGEPEGDCVRTFQILPCSIEGAYVSTPQNIVGIDSTDGKSVLVCYAYGMIYTDDYGTYRDEIEPDGYVRADPPQVKGNASGRPVSVQAVAAPIYYHGKALEPEIWVRLNKGFEAEQGTDREYVIDLSDLLTLNKDYSVIFENNLQAGLASFTVTGKGNYSGVVSGTFPIEPAALENTAVWVKKETVQPSTVNHEEQMTAIARELAVCGQTDLKQGTDYTAKVEFDGSRFAIQVDGIGNYKGNKADECLWHCRLLQPEMPADLLLEGAELPANLKILGKDAFAGTELSVLDLRKTRIEHLSLDVFAESTNLRAVLLPDTVSSLKNTSSQLKLHGFWLIFSGKSGVSWEVLDAISYETGLFYRILGDD